MDAHPWLPHKIVSKVVLFTIHTKSLLNMTTLETNEAIGLMVRREGEHPHEKDRTDDEEDPEDKEFFEEDEGGGEEDFDFGDEDDED